MDPQSLVTDSEFAAECRSLVEQRRANKAKLEAQISDALATSASPSTIELPKDPFLQTLMIDPLLTTDVQAEAQVMESMSSQVEDQTWRNPIQPDLPDGLSSSLGLDLSLAHSWDIPNFTGLMDVDVPKDTVWMDNWTRASEANMVLAKVCERQQGTIAELLKNKEELLTVCQGDKELREHVDKLNGEKDALKHQMEHLKEENAVLRGQLNDPTSRTPDQEQLQTRLRSAEESSNQLNEKFSDALGQLSNALGDISNAMGHIANGAVKNKDRHHLCQQLVYFAALVGDRFPLPADPFSDTHEDPAFRQLVVVRDLMRQFESRYPQEGKSLHVKGAANTILGGTSRYMRLVDDGDVEKCNTLPGCMDDYYRELDAQLEPLSEQSRPT